MLTVPRSVLPGGTLTLSSVKDYRPDFLPPNGGVFRFVDKLFNRGGS